MIEQTTPEGFRELAEVQQKNEDALFQKANVVGVGLGTKVVDGEDTGEPAIQVFVDQKLPPEMLLKEDMVKSGDVGKKAVDVVEVGTITAGAAFAPDIEVPLRTDSGDGARGEPELADEYEETMTFDEVARPMRTRRRLIRPQREVAPEQLRQRVRPALGGFSVGHPRVTAGTIGTCCYDLSPFPGVPQRYYILSNNHVIANSNNANIGDPILQPGAFDGGRLPRDMIGRLSRFIPIRFRTGTSAPLNFVDAAIAEAPFHTISRVIFWIGYVKDLYTAPTVGTIVQKTGRTTNYTTGRITSINATVDVNYGSGRVARFARQILTTRMSAGGDSGSLVLDLNERAVGLLFAGSPSVTVLNNILFVQSLLRVRIHEF